MSLGGYRSNKLTGYAKLNMTKPTACY